MDNNHLHLPNVWVVTAYLWGCRDNHSYVVGVYITKEAAIQACELEATFRGGKYGVEAVKIPLETSWKEWTSQPRPERYYVESAYVGKAGKGQNYCDPESAARI